MNKVKLSNKKLTQLLQITMGKQNQIINYLNAYIEFNGNKKDFNAFLEEKNKKRIEDAKEAKEN